MLTIKIRRTAGYSVFALVTLITGVYLAERWVDFRRPPIKSPREHIAEGGMFCNSVTYYNSPADARNGLRRDLNRAINIVGPEPKTNWLGWNVGERVIAAYQFDKSKAPWVNIEWTEGRRLHSICASDLQLALEYEREANSCLSQFPGF